jgi:hypothetical protein
MSATKKFGRPPAGEARESMRKVTFRLDAETLAALEVLEVDVGPDVRGRRSVLLRRLILNAFALRRK